MTQVPALETARLLVRPFVMDDLADVHRLMDLELGRTAALTERQQWLQWSVLNYEQLAKLNQPPYGDRAMVLKSTGQLIGSCGYVPCLNPFGQIPGLAGEKREAAPVLNSTEFGLFYAVSPSHQRCGYATEAAQALVDYALKTLRLKRVIATTDYENVASIGVMAKLGMRIANNPLPDPPWFQVVGVLEQD